MAAATVISNEEWDGQRENITKLYGEQEWPLKQVIKKLRTKDFNPTEAQVRSKLKKWKVIKPHRQSRKKHSLGLEGKPTSKSRFPTRPDPPVEEDETPSSPRDAPEDDSPINQAPQSASANWTPPELWSNSSDPQSTSMHCYNFNTAVDTWHGSSFAAQQQGRHHYTSVEVQADGIPSSSPMHALHPPMSVWPPSQPNWAPSIESPLSPFYNPPPSLLSYADAVGSLHTWGTSNIEASHSHLYPQQSQPLSDVTFQQKAPLLDNVPYSHLPQIVIDPLYSHPPQFSPMPSQNEMSTSPSAETCFWPEENLTQAKQRIQWRSSNERSLSTEDGSRVNRPPRLRHPSILNSRKLSNGELKAESQRSNRYEGGYGPPISLHRQSQAPPNQELDPNPYHINYTYPAVLQTTPVPTNLKYTQPQTQSYPVWPQMHGSPVPLPQPQPYQDHPPTMYQ